MGSEEIRKAEQILIRLVQSEEFNKDIKELRKIGMVSYNSQIKLLNPFIDKDGILRVGGRLTSSDLNFDKKFPIILPAKHKITYLIV